MNRSASDCFHVDDEIAYILPMGIFLVFTQLGVWWPGLYPWTYLAKTLVVGACLIILRRRFTPITWRYLWLGALLGAVGVVQWIAMQRWLEGHFAIFAPAGTESLFDPFTRLHTPLLARGFIAVRLAGAVVVVPMMEELFWRDFLWRKLAAPNDFKLASIGEWDVTAFLVVPLAFACVHGVWGATAVVWAFMIGALLLFTRSLGACIVMHSVTNLLLGIYVLKNGAWGFW